MRQNLLVEAICAESSNHIDYIKAMVMPDKILLGEQDNRTFAQNNSSSIKSQMKPLPEHMDVFGNSLSE